MVRHVSGIRIVAILVAVALVGVGGCPIQIGKRGSSKPRMSESARQSWDNAPDTLLHEAVRRKEPVAVTELLNGGTEVDVRGRHGMTSLHLAALHGYDTMVEELLDRGALINRREYTADMTPLHVASAAGETEVVRTLLARGANASLKDRYGQTPEQAADTMAGRRRRPPVPARSSASFDPRAIVYFGYWTEMPRFVRFSGLRIGFVVAEGRYIVTAAHCVEDREPKDAQVLRVRLRVVSPFHGDLFEAKVVAVDRENDVAVLEPAWSGHPSLALGSQEQMQAASQMVIAGYPPSQVVDGSLQIAREVYLEQIPVWRVNVTGKASAITLQGGRYAGPGWSGSPILLPQSDIVVGVFGKHHYYERDGVVLLHQLKGAPVGTVHDLLKRLASSSDARPATVPAPPTDAAECFSYILKVFASLSNRDESELAQGRELMKCRPESVPVRLFVTNAISTDEMDELTTQLVESALREALELSPGDPEVHYSLGQSYLRTERKQEALEHFCTACRLDPTHLPAAIHQMDLLVEDRAAEAEQLARDRLERFPDHPALLYELAGALEKLDRLEEALAASERAACLGPDRDHRLRYADLLARNGRYAAADRQYHKALEGHDCGRCWRRYLNFLVKHQPQRLNDLRDALAKVEHFRQCGPLKESEIEELRKKVAALTDTATQPASTQPTDRPG